MADSSAPKPLSQSNAGVARQTAPFSPARAVLREIAHDRGGRVELKFFDPTWGYSTRPPEGVGPETPGYEHCWLHVGRPGHTQRFVPHTRPCATPDEAWDALVENMALTKPGRLLARSVDYFEVSRPTPLGLIRRAERLEAREIEGGVQVLIVTSLATPRLEPRDIAQNRVLDPAGRQPQVFADVNHAKSYISAFIADFRQAALDDRQAALEAQRDNSGLFR